MLLESEVRRGRLITTVGTVCRSTICRSSLVLALVAGAAVSGDDWPQWRGPNSTGVALSSRPLPEKFSPVENVRWSTELGDGISSPVVVAGRLFSTAILGEKPGNQFVVFCHDAVTGVKIWQRDMEVTGEVLPKIHASNSYASSTPAADAERVYVYLDRKSVV